MNSPDVDACVHALREGSKSFFVASKLLPSRLRGPASVVYAFCRRADDAVDESEEPFVELARVRKELDAAYNGEASSEPVLRALSEVVREFRLPKEAFLGLFEGFEWDLTNRTYTTFDELVEYCVRVASTVGVLMAVLMGERRRSVLYRACDLGVAMQLTNIARDVGADAGLGRVYLPREWLRIAGVDSEILVNDPTFTPDLGQVVHRLLLRAQHFYRRADAGICHLPLDCRLAIGAASRIYEHIGSEIAKNEYDTVTSRAYTNLPRKLRSIAHAATFLPSRRFPENSCSVLMQAEFLLVTFD